MKNQFGKENILDLILESNLETEHFSYVVVSRARAMEPNHGPRGSLSKCSLVKPLRSEESLKTWFSIGCGSSLKYGKYGKK